MNNTDNRRTAPRILARILVDYESDNTFLFDYSRDISEGGIFIETDSPLDEGSEVRLRFSLPDIDHVFNVKGRVAWINTKDDKRRKDIGNGMGVEFISLADEDKAILSDYVTRFLK